MSGLGSEVLCALVNTWQREALMLYPSYEHQFNNANCHGKSVPLLTLLILLHSTVRKAVFIPVDSAAVIVKPLTKVTPQ